MGLMKIINELAVLNVAESIDFYNNYFGFSIEYKEGEPITWTQLKKDNIILMLEDYNELKKEIPNCPNKVNNCNLIMFEYENIEDLKELYQLLKDNGVEFFKDYIETDYGKVEFGIYDPDKNMLLISSTL